MPNFVEAASGSEDERRLFAKAEEWGLPVILVFSMASGGLAWLLVGALLSAGASGIAARIASSSTCTGADA